MTVLEVSKRNLMGWLGLAPWGAVISSEDAGEMIDGTPPGVPQLAKRSVETQAKIADALERIVHGIRSQEIAVGGFEIKSAFMHPQNDAHWLNHELKLTFELLAE